jgi:hypothetical protein
MNIIEGQIIFHREMIKLHMEQLNKLISSLQASEPPSEPPLLQASEPLSEPPALQAVDPHQKTNNLKDELDNDDIWDRIKNIHESKMPKSDMRSGQPADQPATVVKVSRLSKFTEAKQNQIIKNIYEKAKTNIERLAEIDQELSQNMEENINQEADRLLQSYLNGS